MHGLIPYSRLTPLSRFSDFGSAFDDFFGKSWSLSEVAGSSFRLDLREEAGHYIVEAELPGVSKEDISLDMTEGELTIAVKREENTEDEKANYIHRERRSYNAQRRVYLPGVKADEISAKFSHGILTVTVPRVTPEEAKSKIEIQ